MKEIVSSSCGPGLSFRVLLAAATARRVNPLLPRRFAFIELVGTRLDEDGAEGMEDVELMGVALVVAFLAAAVRSIRLRNGLGRFSSSVKSYSGEGCVRGTGICGSVVARVMLPLLLDGRKCGWGNGFADDWRFERLVVSVVARGADSVRATRVAERMDGRRMRVGGGESLSLSRARSRSRRELGEGGGLMTESALAVGECCWKVISPSPSSKSKILAKFKPTFGEQLKSLTSSFGTGVCKLSPVDVKTTPFMADAMVSSYVARETGVSKDDTRAAEGLGVGRRSNRVRR